MADLPQIEIEGLNFTAFGSFNPAIFHPLWFAGNNLIRREEAESAKVNLVSTDISIWSVEWLSVQVLNERCSFDTTDPTKTQVLRDLILGTFRILEHSPVKQFGFTRAQHFRLASPEDLNAFGCRFVPEDNWTALLRSPEFRSLAVQGKRDGCTADRMHFQIERSVKVIPGVYVQTNQHYEIPNPEDVKLANRILLDTIRKWWDEFVTYSDSVSSQLFSEFGS